MLAAWSAYPLLNMISAAIRTALATTSAHFSGPPEDKYIADSIGLARLYLFPSLVSKIAPHMVLLCSFSNWRQNFRAGGNERKYPGMSSMLSRPKTNPRAMRDPITAPHVSPRRATPGT